MQRKNTGVSRRDVLRTTGGVATASVATTGLAAAKPGDKVEINVGVSDGPGKQAVLSKATEVVRDFESLDVVTVQTPKAAIDGLRKNPHVEFVEENGTMRALAQTLPWGVDRVDADVAHNNGDTGGGADVAIIDTGIDDDHPGVEHMLGSGQAFVNCGSGGYFGCYFFGNNNACNQNWSDDNDHGTHCAGIAAGVDDSDGIVGVAPDVTLHAVKVLDCAGSGSYSDIAAGIQHVANQGWDVASMSLGGSASSTVQSACQYAANQGVTLVAAAGNSGPCSNCVGYPAAYPEVIAVSATSCDDSMASFSSTGPQVELAAPGENVYSTVPSGYATFSGTSMACPHAAGAAGLLAAQGQSRSAIRSTLQSSAQSLGHGSNQEGHGLLDVAAALGHNSSDDGTGNGPNC